MADTRANTRARTPGRFISLEGGEGSGKSTQIKALKTRLETDHGLSVITTREPGGTDGAEEIRNLLVTGAADRWDGVEETLLLFAARRQHVSKVIRPAIEGGKWVLCDRFTDSTRVYQGRARGVEPEVIEAVKEASIGALEPDLTLVLDLDPAVGLARAQARRGKEQRFEEFDIAFHSRLRAGFHDLAGKYPERIKLIDANADIDNVSDRLMDAIEKKVLGTLSDRQQ